MKKALLTERQAPAWPGVAIAERAFLAEGVVAATPTESPLPATRNGQRPLSSAACPSSDRHASLRMKRSPT